MIRNTFLAAGMVGAIALSMSSLALAHQSAMRSGNPQYDCPYTGQMGSMMGQQGQMPMMGQGQGSMMGQGRGPMMDPQGQMPMMGQQGHMPMMGQGMMGQGMMGQSMGPGMMQPLRQDLTTADVQHMLDHELAWQGNPNIKLGPVEETDDDTITADIVTQDGSLVQKLEIDRHTGSMHPVQ
ncbi:MAG TPA: hypothetical protein VKN76_14055 [Kiloniellaceae bacterium]|nr:hypothetical protein [Kiloniellaceae bacterium]